MRCSDFMAHTGLWRRFSDFRHVTSFKTRVPSLSLTLWKVSREHIFTPKTLEQSELGQEEPFSSGEIICCNYKNTWAADITARGRKKRKKTSPRQKNQCVTVTQLFLPDCDSSTQPNLYGCTQTLWNTASELSMSHLVCILEKRKLWCWWKKKGTYIHQNVMSQYLYYNWYLWFEKFQLDSHDLLKNVMPSPLGSYMQLKGVPLFS